MRDLGAELIAAEISSHALDMNRVASTRFAVAAFTNLSQDHLDFHGTMESYRSAKERLFRDFDVGTSVINVDDPVGADIADWVRGPKILIGRHGEVSAGDIHSSFDGTSFQLVTPVGTAVVSSSLIGAFNVENALVAVGCCLALGSSLDEIVLGLSELRGVPGRFELVGEREGISVVVDYAHTPDGIHEAISVARALSDGRVIAVVGAGGDRDREKRPLMGRAASEADVTIITSDNPRTEDPDRILSDVAAGATTAEAVLEVDRRRAIARAIGSAERGDVVLILGKGHETGQEIDGRVFPFDDRDVARELLGLGASSPESGPDSGSMSL
jgi:UDP-N-acetylmuramyl-tripeptide synthetase